jgi:septal ring factor EnvC (AmiA/AmiB activator)
MALKTELQIAVTVTQLEKEMGEMRGAIAVLSQQINNNAQMTANLNAQLLDVQTAIKKLQEYISELAKTVPRNIITHYA